MSRTVGNEDPVSLRRFFKLLTRPGIPAAASDSRRANARLIATECLRQRGLAEVRVPFRAESDHLH
jgi:hypothetical protein